MIIPDWIYQTAVLAILGYFFKRYIDGQDKRFDMMAENLKEFTTAIDQLKTVISGLRTVSATQKTICIEKHKQIDDTISELKKKIEHL